MAQLSHMTVTMKTMQAQLKTLTSAKSNQSRSRGINTAVVAGAISLTGAKPAHQRNRDIKMKPTTRKVWMDVKRYVNDA